MIRFLFRFLGLVTLAAAFVLVVYDGANFIANRRLDLTTIESVWALLHPNSLKQFQPTVEQNVAPWLWQSVVQPYFLEQPASLLLILVGALFILLGRRKKPLIGYAR
jgi:hypothetical protein